MKTLLFLPAPTGLASSYVTATSVELNWDGIAKAEYYEIWRDGIYLDQSDSPTFIDTTAEPKTTHMYEIRAVNGNVMSSFSAKLAVTTLSLLGITENWENNTYGGWTAVTNYASIIGLRNSGGSHGDYLHVAANYSWIVLRNATENFTGDLIAAGINKASVDISAISGSCYGAYMIFRSDTGSLGWYYRLSASSYDGSWRTFSVEFDPTWTDAEAKAARWYQSDTTRSFTATMADMRTLELWAYGSSKFQAGIDNFQFCFLGIPNNLTTVEVTGSSASFTWSAVEGATYYEIYRDGIYLGQSNSNLYTDANLNSGIPYEYEVRAVNGSIKSPLSEILVVSTLSAIITAENWENGNLNGWRGNTAWTTVEVANSGGNPGKYLRSTGTWYWAGACNETGIYSGNMVALGVKRISVDLSVIKGTFYYARLRFRYKNSSYNGWYRTLVNSPSSIAWQTYSITFNPAWTDTEAKAAGWIQEDRSASFIETMSDLYTTEIRLYGPGSTESVVGIDNLNFYAE